MRILLLVTLLSVSHSNAFAKPPRALFVGEPAVTARIDPKLLRYEISKRLGEDPGILIRDDRLMMATLNEKIETIRLELEYAESDEVAKILGAARGARMSMFQNFEKKHALTSERAPVRKHNFRLAAGLVAGETAGLQQLLSGQTQLPPRFPKSLRENVSVEHARILALAFKSNRTTAQTKVQVSDDDTLRENCVYEFEGERISSFKGVTAVAGASFEIAKICYDGTWSKGTAHTTPFQESVYVQMKAQPQLTFKKTFARQSAWQEFGFLSFAKIVSVESAAGDLLRLSVEDANGRREVEVPSVLVLPREQLLEASNVHKPQSTFGIIASTHKARGEFSKLRMNNLQGSNGFYGTLGIYSKSEVVSYELDAARVYSDSETSTHAVERTQNYVLSMRAVLEPEFRVPVAIALRIAPRVGLGYLFFTDEVYYQRNYHTGTLVTFGASLRYVVAENYEIATAFDFESLPFKFTNSQHAFSLRVGYAL